MAEHCAHHSSMLEGPWYKVLQLCHSAIVVQRIHQAAVCQCMFVCLHLAYEPSSCASMDDT